MIKGILKRAAGAFGYEIRKRTGTPPGVDWVTDVRRLLAGISAPVIFDVGANIGDVTRRLAGAFPPPARVFSFEPTADTFRRLQKNVAIHPNVQAHRLALGSNCGRMQLHHGINSQLNRLAPLGALGRGTHEDVELTTIDHVAATLEVTTLDVLKTDTEGFDVAVLAGASGMLAGGRVRAVVSEVTFDLSDDVHTHFDDVRAALVSHGFCLHRIYDCEFAGPRLYYCNALFIRQVAFACDSA